MTPTQLDALERWIKELIQHALESTSVLDYNDLDADPDKFKERFREAMNGKEPNQ